LREREKEGKLDMYYCDESGFSLESSVPYAWQKKGGRNIIASRNE
jgi:hypothetical protein